MSALEITLRLTVGLLLLLGNAFFVVTEFALTRLRQLDPEEIEADSGLRVAWQMTERLEIYLTGCQVGITTTSVLLGVVAEPAVTAMIRPAATATGLPERLLPGISIVLAVLLINLAHTIWGEQVPTYLGVERPGQVARWAARPHRLWTRTVYPLIWVGDSISKLTLRLFGIHMSRSWTRDDEGAEAQDGRVGHPELRRQMGEILSRGELTSERRREVLNALAIDRIPVERIMVPRGEIVALSAEEPFARNFEILTTRRHSRFPLVGESLDDVLGTVYTPALFGKLDALGSGELRIEEVAVPAMTVGPEMTVSRLIDRFQDARQELALVEREGRVLGLVTVTDAFEAIAGELEDPFD